MPGPTIKLTFAGDSAQLDKTMANVGSGTQKMASDVGASSKKIGSSAKEGFDKAEEGADKGEKRFQGFADTIGGTGDIMQGFKDGDIAGMAMGFADLAGGLADFVIPMLASVGTTLFSTVIPAVWGFTSALLANPITWIVVGIIALIAVIILLVTHFDAVKRVVGDVVGWIVDKWNWAVAVFRIIASNIGGFFSHIWDGLTNGAKYAINWVIDMLNHAIDALNFLVRGLNYVPGVNIPMIGHIPKFHTGGVVPGTQGQEMIATLQAGERVIPRTQAADGGGGGGTISFGGNVDGAFASAFMKLVREGKIQVGV